MQNANPGSALLIHIKSLEQQTMQNVALCSASFHKPFHYVVPCSYFDLLRSN